MAQSTLERIRSERLAKAEAMREAGQNPYANDFGEPETASELSERYAHIEVTQGFPGEDAPAHVFAGRVMAWRHMGKMSFLKLRDRSGDLQVMLRKEILGPDLYDTLRKQGDVGDIAGFVGPMMRTRTGELTLLARQARILTKSIRPLPDKWHGLTDVEARYRQRYVDLFMSPETREVFALRARVVGVIRRYLDDLGFLEVETPILQTLAGGAAARPFVTHHNTLDIPMYLRIAPELFLKRLVVGGLERVYELNRCFRNEGMSHWHNPEFSMLELYWAHATYDDLIDLTEDLLCRLVTECRGGTEVSWRGDTLSFQRPFRRVTLRDAIREHMGRPDLALEEASEIAALLDELEADRPVVEDYGRLLMALFEEVAEPKLRNPTFVTQFPIEVSPLSRKNEKDPRFVDRFELIAGGKELANAFSEINDPVDQRERFEAQLRDRAAGDDEAQPMDDDYVRALEFGMPPTAGEGIGIDRLVMLLADRENIRDVILFPTMRPEQSRQADAEEPG